MTLTGPTGTATCLAGLAESCGRRQRPPKSTAYPWQDVELGLRFCQCEGGGGVFRRGLICDSKNDVDEVVHSRP